MKYDDEYDYYITLTSKQFSSLFSNIVTDKNNKFKYFKDMIQHIIKFADGAYEIKDIIAIIQ